VYLGKSTQPWVHTEFGLRMFAADEARARRLYRAFVERSVATIDPMQEVHGACWEMIASWNDFRFPCRAELLRRHSSGSLPMYAGASMSISRQCGRQAGSGVSHKLAR
jgi:hypothetical protein